MNYIEQINGFWALAEEKDFSANDQSTYFALLKYCNRLNWLNPFVCHWDILIQYSKTSKNSFYKSLAKLNDEGVIKFEKGQRNSSKKPKVFILDFKNKKGTIREQQGNKEGTKEEQKREQKGNLYKHINKETIKLINSNAEIINNNLSLWLDEYKKGSKNSDSIYYSFDHLSITKKEYQKLLDEYTKDQIQMVFDSIQNHSNNKKYKSLYLTSKNWLKRDQDKKTQTQKVSMFKNLVV